MDNKTPLSRQLRKGTIIDACIALVFVIIATLVSMDWDIVEALYLYTRAHEEWELDEALLVALWVGLASFIYVFRRLYDIKKLNQQIGELAYYDPITRLPNRIMAGDRLSQMLAHAKRHNTLVGVLYIDFDNFKFVNDTYGHEAGDTLIFSVAKRLAGNLRGEDVMARLGGDEFIILIDSPTATEDILEIGKRLVHSTDVPFRVGNDEIHITISLGISVYPENASSAEDLLKAADTAMYQAKQQGKNQICFFSEDMNSELVHRHKLESGLRHAIENEELFLCYQPQIASNSKAVIACEALLRWRFGDKLIPPDKFIPIAEESGLILSIGEWVLRTACAQAAQWPNIRIAVNISAKQLQQDNFTEMVISVLSDTSLPPQMLELEVTESAIINDPSATSKKFKTLRNLGVHLAIDDFGTGYSSLERLKNFEIDKLKIDRGFIKDLLAEKNNNAIITKAIIALSKSMGMKSVAEGVETLEQAEFLIQNECDSLQGYYYSKPVLAGELTDYINKHIPFPSRQRNAG